MFFVSTKEKILKDLILNHLAKMTLPKCAANCLGNAFLPNPIVLVLGLFENTKENLKNTKDFSHLANSKSRKRAEYGFGEYGFKHRTQ